VLAATSTPAALAAKAATTTIPIVFTTAGDPVQLDLVTSLSRPSGNITGVTMLDVEVAPKRLQLAHELAPTATTMAVLVNPAFPPTETMSRELLLAAKNLGLNLHVANASSEREIDEAFATVAQLRIGALVIHLSDAAPVADQPAGRGEIAVLKDRGYRVTERECSKLLHAASEENISGGPSRRIRWRFSSQFEGTRHLVRIAAAAIMTFDLSFVVRV
jgi:hypothetical protein